MSISARRGIAVLVARQVADLGELRRIDPEHDALGDDRDAVAAAVARGV